jgi:iron-sulfur cluster assembly protein
MFKLTAAAAEQVRSAARDSGADGMAVRLAASKKTDGTIDYKMGFDEVSEDDIRFTTEGVEVVMAPEYVPLLDTATLDFVELEPGERQFIFLNPQDAAYVPPEGADAG